MSNRALGRSQDLASLFVRSYEHAEDDPNEEARDYTFDGAEAAIVDIGELTDLLRASGENGEESGDKPTTREDDVLSDDDAVLFANQVSSEDLHMALSYALQKAYPKGFGGVRAVFENAVVFTNYDVAGPMRLMRQAYKITDKEDGHVELSGNATPVRAITRFVDDPSAAAPEAAATAYLAAFEALTEMDFDHRSNAMARARTPSWSGKTSDSVSRPSLAEFLKLAPGDASPRSNVSALPSSTRRWIASRTLLGDPAANTFRDLTLFPVVDAKGRLSATLLRAVLSGRGAQAGGISAAALDSARSVARRLLTSEFGADLKASEESSDQPKEDAEKSESGLLTSSGDDSHTSPDDEAKRRSAEQNTGKAAKEIDMTREERISKLVANEKSGYTKQDAEWMSELSDAAFDRVEAVASERATKNDKPESDGKADASRASEQPDTNGGSKDVKSEPDTKVVDAKSEPRASEQPKLEERAPAAKPVPKTAEEYLKAFEGPPEVKRVFQRAIDDEKKLRANLIKTISGAKANKFQPKALEAMETDQLEAIAALASGQPDADYSGQGSHTHERRAATERDESEPTARMPAMTGLAIGSALQRGN